MQISDKGLMARSVFIMKGARQRVYIYIKFLWCSTTMYAVIHVRARNVPAVAVFDWNEDCF